MIDYLKQLTKSSTLTRICGWKYEQRRCEDKKDYGELYNYELHLQFFWLRWKNKFKFENY